MTRTTLGPSLILEAVDRGLPHLRPAHGTRLDALPAVAVDAAPECEDRRSYLALDWLVRTMLPTWLRLDPALAAVAPRLERLPVVDGPERFSAAVAHVSAARDATRSRCRAVTGACLSLQPAHQLAMSAIPRCGGYAAWFAADVSGLDTTGCCDEVCEAAREAIVAAVWDLDTGRRESLVEPVVAGLATSLVGVVEQMVWM